ncbi:hypothetical protein EIK76_00190 [Rheinheimera mesophila]|uniref:Uncharacterized protein n=1 Tax=Rheinheimera mesophila TaxID=1547515 RepID=A0A3P3QPW8_9GAMM|nr:hypothetical protein [Rheinheimera mesophila]KKL00287.1 hypothetical protein SD53_15955 [Rheinheimera mesophila]RRJ22540.1 hypothetical protein EIK76_00190 [Rheinheimera mesophila]
MLYQFFIDANDKDNKVSSKALMILFAVGVIPLILGVDVTKINISIPWLMEVTIEHKDRFVLIYAALLLFSVYRFRLSNTETQRYCRLHSASFFFNSQLLGFLFIKNFIFNKTNIKGVSYNSKKKKEELTFICSDGEYDQRENYGYFYLSINDDGQWEYQLWVAEDMSPCELGFSKYWDLNFDPTVFEGDDLYHHSEYCVIKRTRIKLILRAACCLFSLRAAARDIVCLDYYLPVYCNIGLSMFLVWKYM